MVGVFVGCWVSFYGSLSENFIRSFFECDVDVGYFFCFESDYYECFFVVFFFDFEVVVVWYYGEVVGCNVFFFVNFNGGFSWRGCNYEDWYFN